MDVTDRNFLERFYQYKEYAEKGSPQVGPESFTLMPWLNFAQLKPEDLKAIYAFLRTQQSIYHVVDSHPVWQALSEREKPRGWCSLTMKNRPTRRAQAAQ